MSDSLRTHGLQYTKLPCPSPIPGACSNSCPSSRWCHPTISSSVAPYSSCLQFFPASGSFPMSQFFASGGQSIGASASVSVIPMNIQDWFPLGLSGLISLQSKGLSRIFPNTTVQKHQFFSTQLSLWPNSLTSIHDYWKTIALSRWTFVGKVMSLLFNMLSRIVISFLPRNRHLLISWLQPLSAVILEPEKIVCHCFHCFPIYLPWSDGTWCHDFFLILHFKPTFSFSSFTFIKRLFSSLLSAISVVSSVYLRLLTFLLAILIPALIFDYCKKKELNNTSIVVLVINLFFREIWVRNSEPI